MKQLFLSIVALTMVFAVNAQSYQFPKNSEGDIEFSGEFTSTNDAKTSYNKAKSWLNKQGFSEIKMVQDNTGQEMWYTITKNTKSSFNPFAGQFTENLIFNVRVALDGNKVKYIMDNFQIQEIYAGYGVKNKITGLGDMVQTYESLKQQITDLEASGDKKGVKKLKKENKDYLENTPETLEKANQEFTKLTSSFKTALGIN